MHSLWTELPGTACPPGTQGSQAAKGFTFSFESQVPMSIRIFSDLFPLLEGLQNINSQEGSSLTRIPLTGVGWPDICSVPIASQSPEPLEGGRKVSLGRGRELGLEGEALHKQRRGRCAAGWVSKACPWTSLPFSTVRRVEALAPGENTLKGRASPLETTPLLTTHPCPQTTFPLFPDGS